MPTVSLHRQGGWRKGRLPARELQIFEFPLDPSPLSAETPLHMYAKTALTCGNTYQVIGAHLNGVQLKGPAEANGFNVDTTLIPLPCGGHVTPPLAPGPIYHSHKAADCLNISTPGGHGPLIGYANDGFGIYGFGDWSGAPVVAEGHGQFGAVPRADGSPGEVAYHYHASAEYNLPGMPHKPYYQGCQGCQGPSRGRCNRTVTDKYDGGANWCGQGCGFEVCVLPGTNATALLAYLDRHRDGATWLKPLSVNDLGGKPKRRGEPAAVPQLKHDDANSACSGPADCSYNGDCNGATGACSCDAAWLGEHCSILNLLPMPRNSGFNVSTTIGGSWGGSVNLDEDDGKWHMHVAQFENKCGFNQWASNSRIVHAVADAADGGFVMRDTVHDVWAHNPSVARAPGQGLWVMTWVQNQTFNPETIEGVCDATGNVLRNASIPGGRLCAGNMMSTAKSLNGPWSAPVALDHIFDAAVPRFRVPSSCTNLAITIDPDGSLVGLWRRCCTPPPRYAPTGGGGASVIFALRASDWRNLSTWNASDEPALRANGYEDPTVWADPKRTDVFHALFHDMIGGWHKPEFNNTQVGAHAYSADGGSTWVATGVAFGLTARYEDGTSVTFVQRERSHIVLDPKSGAPTHLVSGVTWSLAPTLPTSTIVQRIGQSKHRESSASSGSCAAAVSALRCDGHADDTQALQSALDSCAGSQPVELPAGKTCISFPLTIPSHGGLLLPQGTVLKAGKSTLWPNTSVVTPGTGNEEFGEPFISCTVGAVNLTLRGAGTVDGSGAQWWTGSNKIPNRPFLLRLDAAGVLLQGLLLLNPAAWTTSLAGSDFRIYDIKIRSPDYKRAPNTDGLDISARRVHIRGADITNGDDSICMKSPAQDVLAEDSIVRQGNGLVVGTSADAHFRNITFRNITAIGTAFGCHIKFKDNQTGSVSGVTFEDIVIKSPQRYAIGIDQNNQGATAAATKGLCLTNALVPDAGTNVTINNITFRNITATVGFGHMGGCFVCNPGALACRDIRFERVNLSVAGSGAGADCSFRNVYGASADVYPSSCIPPPERSPAGDQRLQSLKTDDDAPPARLIVTGATVAEPAAPSAPVLLRGFNLDFKLGGKGFELPIAEDKALKTLLPGANFVRLVMNHWHDQGMGSIGKGDCATQNASASFVSAACLRQFDTVLRWSTGKLGAWSVVTARSASAAGDNTDGYGTIFTNSTLRKQWFAMWGALARRYKTMSKIAGYEVMSEPRTDAPAQKVHAIQKQACEAVWKEDPRVVCFVGPAKFYDRYNLNATYLLKGGPVIYAANFFEPKQWVTSAKHNNTTPYGGRFLCTDVTEPEAAVKPTCGGFQSTKRVTVDRAWIAAELETISNFSRDHDVPVWIDQWGLREEDPGGAAVQSQYLQDVLAEFKARKFHWTYWIWRRTSSWGEGGYAIERQSVDGSYSLFELCLKHLRAALGGSNGSMLSRRERGRIVMKADDAAVGPTLSQRLLQAAALGGLLLLASARPLPSLGPGRGSWMLEKPEPFGIPTATMDLVAKRTQAAMPERYCLAITLDGHLISETYFANRSDTTYESDSLGKLMTAQIIGVAHAQGLIDLDKPLQDYGVQARCADGNAAAAGRPPINETCNRLIKTTVDGCQSYGPPWNSAGRHSLHVGPKLPGKNICSINCGKALHKAGWFLTTSKCAREAQQFCKAPNAGGGCWIDSQTGQDYWPFVTARHLMSQTTGMGNYMPGSHFTYDSDQYVDHLAYLVSKVTGEPSQQWATREYANVLGLPADIFAYDDFTDPIDGAEFSPGGGQMMTCRDHLRVAQLLINKGRWYDDDEAERNSSTPRKVKQLLTEEFVKEFLNPAFPKVSKSYGFLTWLNRPVNPDGCCSPRWGGGARKGALNGTYNGTISTCNDRIGTVNAQIIGDNMDANHPFVGPQTPPWPQLERAPADLALGMGMSAKYSIIIPSQGLAMVSQGLSWSSSTTCPLGIYPLFNACLKSQFGCLNLTGTAERVPNGLLAESAGYDDSWASTQLWRSIGNISNLVDKTLPQSDFSVAAPANQQSEDGLAKGRAGNASWAALSKASAAVAPTNGSCYMLCPPKMGFGFCFNLPLNASAYGDERDCGALNKHARAMCPSHGNPRQCQSPPVKGDTDCASAHLQDCDCVLEHGCQMMVGAGKGGLLPPNPAFRHASCRCTPRSFQPQVRWSADPCLYNPFFPPSPIDPRGRGVLKTDDSLPFDGPCTSDLSCSLNGQCAVSIGVCSCDIGFTGRRCERFDFLPTPRGSAFHSPDVENETSSWGGTAAYDPDSKLWQGFFSEFVGGCGVTQWQSNSQIVRAVSSSPLGPFKKQGVALSAFAHNAEARRDPKSGEWFIFHIGQAKNGGNTVSNGIKCTNGSSTSCVQQASSCPSIGIAGVRCCHNQSVHFEPGNTTAAGLMHHANSPLGPWEPVVNMSLANLPGTACHDNPTVAFARNGSIWLLGVCDSTPTPPSDTSVMMLWRADSWDGKFTVVGNITRSNRKNESQWSWVDPTLWVDNRGNIHVVANAAHKDYGCRPYGGHAFSDDGGRTFHSLFKGGGANLTDLNDFAIYNGSTEFADGSSRWVHYERPKIVLGPATGQPVALFMSVGSHGGSPSINPAGGKCGPLLSDRSWTMARPIRTKVAKLDGEEARSVSKPATECHLNGHLAADGKSCVCKSWWRGENCELLNFKPAKSLKQGVFVEDVSTWGASVVKDKDGLYHAHAAEMQGHCGISAWTSQSTCRHFTAADPLGPFTPRGLIQSQFCHNPSATIDADGSWLLYHLGTGFPRHNSSMTEPTYQNCSKGQTLGRAPPFNPWVTPFDGNYKTQVLRSTAGPAGPWTVHNISTTNSDGSKTYGINDNGAPFPPHLQSGQTTSVMFAARNRYLGCPKKDCSQLGIARSSNGWRGPFVLDPLPVCSGKLCKNGTTPDWRSFCEDPTYWRDADGSYHALCNSKDCPSQPPVPVPPPPHYPYFCNGKGMHAYSLSGKSGDWHWQVEMPAYDNTVNMTSGLTTHIGRRERPHLLFAEVNGAWRPTHLFTAATCLPPPGLCSDRSWIFGQALE